jgi:hypothetical protein
MVHISKSHYLTKASCSIQTFASLTHQMPWWLPIHELPFSFTKRYKFLINMFPNAHEDISSIISFFFLHITHIFVSITLYNP